MRLWQRVAIQLMFLLGIAQLTWCEYTDWEEPHAWAQRKVYSSGLTTDANKDDTCNCRAPELSKLSSKNDDNLRFFYKKIVKFLLNRDKMKFDDSSRTFYRSLHLHINEEQMNRFDEMTDVHDIDQLIAEVLHQSRGGTLELFQEMYLTWKDTFLYYWNAVQSSRQIIIGIQFACFVLIWFASRQLNFSFRTVALFFVLYYLYSFLDAECHRKKEIEKAAEMFGMKKENPCNATRSFWAYYFKGNAECQEYLKKSYDESCTLIDIYEEFLNVFVYKQLWNFINNCVGNILKVYSTYGFICANLVTLICVYLFSNYIKLTIESIFKFILTPRAYKPTYSNANGNSQQIDNGNVDRISGENLKKILEIAADHTRLSGIAMKDVKKYCSTSGVQEVDCVDGNESKTIGKEETNQKEKNEESEPFEIIEDVSRANGIA